MSLRLLFLSTTILACDVLSFQRSRRLLHDDAEVVELNSKESNVLWDDRLSSVTTDDDGLFHHYQFRKLGGYNRRSNENNNNVHERRTRTPRITKPPATDNKLSQQQQQQQQQAATRTSQTLSNLTRTVEASAGMSYRHRRRGHRGQEPQQQQATTRTSQPSSNRMRTTEAASTGVSYQRRQGNRGNALFPSAPVGAPTTPPVAPASPFRFEKVGQRLCGGVPFGNFGYGVNLSEQGKRLAMGSPYYRLLSDIRGLVQVYELELGKWNVIGQYIVGMNPPVLIQDGYASLSGDGNYVGYAPGVERAYTYKFYQDAPPPELTNLTSQNPSAKWARDGKFMGMGRNFTAIRLSHDGSRIAVGKHDTMQLYRRGNNTHIAEVSWPIPSSDDPFMRVAISGDGKRVVMFHAFKTRVRVYEYKERMNKMVMVGTPIVSGDPFFRIGSASLSHDGSILALGGSTYARVLEYDGGTWKQKGDDLYLTENANDLTDGPGVLVSLSEGGDRLIASIVYHLKKRTDDPTGRVTIYDFIDDAWKEIGSLLNTKASVDLSPEGNYFAVGSSWKGTDGFLQNGCVTVYQIVPT